jgi:hypothetical protein
MFAGKAVHAMKFSNINPIFFVDSQVVSVDSFLQKCFGPQL